MGEQGGWHGVAGIPGPDMQSPPGLIEGHLSLLYPWGQRAFSDHWDLAPESLNFELEIS